MKQEMANYLVRTHDNHLFTYWTLAILLSDLAANRFRHAPAAGIYRLVNHAVCKYVPVTEDELKAIEKEGSAR
jgi:hypothetical protein